MAETDCWNFEALVLAADILQGGNLLLSHSRHHGHNKVLPFGETILELQSAKPIPQYPRRTKRSRKSTQLILSKLYKQSRDSEYLCKNCIISWQAKIVLGLSIVGKQTHLQVVHVRLNVIPKTNNKLLLVTRLKKAETSSCGEFLQLNVT